MELKSLIKTTYTRLINQPVVTAPIASTTKEQHLKAFIEAVNTILSEKDMQQLNEASSY